MNRKILNLLNEKEENHILPMLWLHGESEERIRSMIRVIREANIRAFVVESRPHPDFCGESWWQDMETVLSEAKANGMKVWILDDSHFPTGYANGAVKEAPLSLHRQSLLEMHEDLPRKEMKVERDVWKLFLKKPKNGTMLQKMLHEKRVRDARYFRDNELIRIMAVSETGEKKSFPLPDKGDLFVWEKPEGKWALWVIGLSRNQGTDREYINMTDPESVRLLIDAVYEPHYAHFANEFGHTIAGFFSDEPSLGNGLLYDMNCTVGHDTDLPFSEPLREEMEKRLGEDWLDELYLLWDNGRQKKATSYVRFQYMDAVTKLVRKNFSQQIGSWCREHGVEYIGHSIEDNNAHAHLGPGLGHYFRGLQGQDMAGIDCIGGQVIPQKEDGDGGVKNPFTKRDGEFYHFMLGELASSQAAIEPGKKGRALCEIFGNYGWEEGIRLEKYLADHFLVRGINYFVPHAFTLKPFPDPDCPPHFYADGNDALYRHFGELMKYMNRVSELISGGHRKAEAAVLYHGDMEWAGTAMLSQKVLRVLTEAQIAADVIPADVFSEPENYRTKTGSTLRVNTQEYKVLIIPECAFLPMALAEGISELISAGCTILFINRFPEGISDAEDEEQESRLLQKLTLARSVKMKQLLSILRELKLQEAELLPSDKNMRVLHYEGIRNEENEADVSVPELYFFVNESAEEYQGEVLLPKKKACYLYDAEKNRVMKADVKPDEADHKRMRLALVLPPLHSIMLVADEADGAVMSEAFSEGEKDVITQGWTRWTSKAVDYPRFDHAKTVTFPDTLAKEEPGFSGFVRYETHFRAQKGSRLTLTVTDASEGIEVFLNGRSAGLQYVPPYQFDLSGFLEDGHNTLIIEAATTMERMMAANRKFRIPDLFFGLPKKPVSGSGITGEVRLKQTADPAKEA